MRWRLPHPVLLTLGLLALSLGGVVFYYWHAYSQVQQLQRDFAYEGAFILKSPNTPQVTRKYRLPKCVAEWMERNVSDERADFLKSDIESVNLVFFKADEQTLRRLQGYSLRELDLNEVVHTDAMMEALSQLSTLEVLVLISTHFNDHSLEFVARLPRLQTLCLANSRITDRGLLSLKSLKGLKSLDLSACEVTDAWLKHFDQFPAIDHIGLNFTKISDAGLEDLGKLPNLKYVSLIGTAVTPEGIRQLKTKRPDLQIESD